MGYHIIQSYYFYITEAHYFLEILSENAVKILHETENVTFLPKTVMKMLKCKCRSCDFRRFYLFWRGVGEAGEGVNVWGEVGV